MVSIKTIKIGDVILDVESYMTMRNVASSTKRLVHLMVHKGQLTAPEVVYIAEGYYDSSAEFVTPT